ncbi:M20 family metallopeptidase [Ancylobacter terrae]|uniref:M20 family metallopeptidase n=1 Tax=Ancylobacter sp. sgz301288 TaxID=3342077 RepID=UPI00385DCD35
MALLEARWHRAAADRRLPAFPYPRHQLRFPMLDTISTTGGIDLPDPERVIATVSAMCERSSVSGTEGALAEWVEAELSRMGLATRRQEVLPARSNIIATLETGRPGPTLLFNGHLDTLPVPAGYSHDPFRSFVRDGRIYGAEINNMKGAVAAMIGAMGALSSAKEQLCGRIILSAVMGECDSLGLGTVALVEDGLSADFCINGEPTDLQVMTCHVGVTQLRVRARGSYVHVSRRHDDRNAIAELLPALASIGEGCLTFRPHPDFPGLPTINIGKVTGGSMASMLAAEAEALIDVRTVPGMTPESVLADIERAIAGTRTPAGTIPDVEISLIERPVFCQQHPYLVDRDHTVVGAVAHAHQRLTGTRPYVGPLYPQVFFGTDASHLNRAGIATVIYGPGKCEEINVVDESMRVDDLIHAANVYTLAGALLCAQQ